MLGMITLQQQRPVDDHGETLVVWEHEGVKALVDPCDHNVSVVVPAGRRAKLVRFSFCGLSPAYGRDAHVVVFNNGSGPGFALDRHPSFKVYLEELSQGQLVDVFPAAEPAAIYAVVHRPLPVLYGAAAAQPHYYKEHVTHAVA